MPELQATQRKFWSSIKHRKADAAAIELVREGGKISRERRMDIYRTTMREAHVRALATTYACCEKILGERYFRQLATEFYYGNPATHQDLNRYGQAFPDFMREFIEHHAELAEYPYLADLARLEWLYEQAYYTREDAAFDFRALAMLDEDDYRKLHFVLGASVATLKSDYPVYELWRAHQGQGGTKEVTAIDEPQYLCVAREEFKPRIHRIDHAFQWVMNKIDQGCAFGELETLVEQESMRISLQAIIPELIARKWICGYQVASVAASK
ncbi:MAG: DUF2063 domain-containing protein [Proteobacteria bacterium]|nr:DUF2063 domain-containing protein [Pseudomonadota bacterium]